MRQVVDLTTGSISENSVVRRGICIDGNKEDGEVGGHGGRRKKVRRDPNNQIANPNPGSLQSPVRPGRPSVISSSVHSLSPESVRVHVILHNTKHTIGQQVTECPSVQLRPGLETRRDLIHPTNVFTASYMMYTQVTVTMTSTRY